MRIIDYPQAAGLDGTELLPLFQNGTQVQARTTQLAQLLANASSVAAAAAIAPFVAQVNISAQAAQQARAQADADVVATGQNLQLVRAAKLALDQALTGTNPLGIIINGAGLQFETIGAAQLAQVPAGTKQIATLGFYGKNDGGGGTYKPVAANPNVGAGAFQSTDGQWWQLCDTAGVVRIRQFGAMGNAVYNLGTGKLVSGNNDRQALLDAIALLTITPGSIIWSMAAEVRLGFGQFYVGSTFEWHKRIRIIGNGNGRVPAGQGDVTQLVFDGGTCAMRFNSAGTHGGTAVAFNSQGGSADGSLIQGVGFVQMNTAFVAKAHAIQAHIRVDVLQCTFNGVGDTGIYSVVTSGSGGTTEGESNRGLIRDVTIQQGFGDGINLGGGDGNCWLVENYETHQLAGCAIVNTPYFVNTFINVLLNGFGNGGVVFGGRAFCLLVPGQGTVKPGTNNAIWYDLGPLASTADTQYPPWQPNTQYRMQLPIYSPGAASEFRGAYAESQRNVALVGGAITGTITCTNTSAGWLTMAAGTDVGKGAITCQRGFGTSTGFAPSEAAVTFMGTSAFAYFGTLGYGSTGVQVAEWGRASEGGTWRWDQIGVSGYDQAIVNVGAQPSAIITGVNTQQTFNSPSPMPRIFGVSDLGLYNWQDYVHSILAARATTPKGPVGVGSLFINQDMRAGNFLAWRVITGGIAGSTAVLEKIAGTVVP